MGRLNRGIFKFLYFGGYLEKVFPAKKAINVVASYEYQLQQCILCNLDTGEEIDFVYL